MIENLTSSQLLFNSCAKLHNYSSDPKLRLWQQVICDVTKDTAGDLTFFCFCFTTLYYIGNTTI